MRKQGRGAGRKTGLSLSKFLERAKTKKKKIEKKLKKIH
jgi:hypothetical protein